MLSFPPTSVRGLRCRSHLRGARSRRRAVFTALACVFLARAVCSAQSVDPRRDAKLHMGPFYVTPSVVLRDAGVDTNVFNSEGQQRSDFTFTLEPKVDLWMPFGRKLLFTVSPMEMCLDRVTVREMKDEAK